MSIKEKIKEKNLQCLKVVDTFRQRALRLWIYLIKASPQALSALLGGQVDFLFITFASISSQVSGGKLKLLAVSSAKRSQLAPNVPTFIESGVSDYDFTIDQGISAPAGTPVPVVSKLSAEIIRAVKHPDTQQWLTSIGIEPVGSTPDVYAARIRADFDRYARAVKISGAKSD